MKTLAFLLTSLCAAAQTYPAVQGKTFKGNNNVVIVNNRDVIVADNGTTPPPRALCPEARPHRHLTFDVLHREPFTTCPGTHRVAQEANRGATDSGARNAARRRLNMLEQLKATPPNVTYSSKLVFHKGRREIQPLTCRSPTATRTRAAHRYPASWRC
jgi:hypothetical protein